MARVKYHNCSLCTHKDRLRDEGVKTYKEGGRGRKRCTTPGCGKFFVGSRLQKCPVCHKVFQSRKRDKEIKAYKRSRKGYKQCPNCLWYIPARTQKCDCGHTFPKKRKEVKTPRQKLIIAMTKCTARQEMERLVKKIKFVDMSAMVQRMKNKPIYA